MPQPPVPPVRIAPPVQRHGPPPVCPILTLGLLQPPSSLVTNAPPTIPTVSCLGPRCAFFHGAGACAVLVMGDAMLAQAHMMAGEQEEKPDEDPTRVGAPS